MFSPSGNLRASPQMARVLDDGATIEDRRPNVKINYPRFYASHPIIINSPNAKVIVHAEEQKAAEVKEEKPTVCCWPFNLCCK